MVSDIFITVRSVKPTNLNDLMKLLHKSLTKKIYEAEKRNQIFIFMINDKMLETCSYIKKISNLPLSDV